VAGEQFPIACINEFIIILLIISIFKLGAMLKSKEKNQQTYNRGVLHIER
jgi:hypothetical protein